MVAFLKISLLMLSGTSTSSSFLMINPLSIPTTALHADSQMDMDDNHFHPCWQEVWPQVFDDDCDMSSIFAASFIAKDWIKSMPCAAGIEVRKKEYYDSGHLSLLFSFKKNSSSERTNPLYSLLLFYYF